MKGNVAARRIIGTVSAFLGSVEDIKLQQKEVIPTKDTQQVSADEGYDALSMVTVNPIPDKYIVPTGTVAFTKNGTYDIRQYESAVVGVSGGETIRVSGWERGGLNSANGEPNGTLLTQRVHTEEFVECKKGDVITAVAPRYMYVYLYDLTTHQFLRNSGAWASEYTVSENVAVRFVGKISVSGIDGSGDQITDDAVASFNVEIQRGGGGTVTPVLQDKSATPTKSQQTFNADEGFDGIGTFTVQAIPSEYIIPSGTKEITTNGTHDVKQYESAEVNVPIPEGYIVPSGTIEITESGTYDVTNYASAEVNVSGGGDLVEYSGSAWCGSSIAYPETSQFSINVGAEIPEKFLFYAYNWTGFSVDKKVNQIMRNSDGSCCLLKTTANTSNGSTYYLITRVDAASSCISVSADRKSITYNPPSDTTWSGGTWYWTLITEG